MDGVVDVVGVVVWGWVVAVVGGGGGEQIRIGNVQYRGGMKTAPGGGTTITVMMCGPGVASGPGRVADMVPGALGFIVGVANGFGECPAPG